MGKHSYAVILDAGSSGTRVYVYKWRKADSARETSDQKRLQGLPDIETNKKWTKKIQPGISSFGDAPEAVGTDHLKPLVAFALDIVPASEVGNTPIFVLATAGMRLLHDVQRNTLLESTCSFLRLNTEFQLPDCGLHVQVITGETEGLYGWIAANYLLGGFEAPGQGNHGNRHHTYGFLDMGGASAQIAFSPNATEAEKHADDLKLLRLRTVNGEALEYKVFVTTWLGFGANEARRRYVEHIREASPDAQELPDPCLPAGIRTQLSGEEIESGSDTAQGKEPYLIGTGKFEQCLRSTYPLLGKERKCIDQPCLMNGVHTPAIDFHANHFVGVSEYWYATHEVFAPAQKDEAYDFYAYEKRVKELCSREWADIKKDIVKERWGHNVGRKTVEGACFKASWLINMLHYGLEVPRAGIEHSSYSNSVKNKTKQAADSAKDRDAILPFRTVDKIDGKDVSWTLGKVVLYASSQMPAADPTLAVGFGSNVPDPNVPDDFEYAGGRIPPLAAVKGSNSTLESTEWYDRVLSSSQSRRVPGILIFLLILILAGLLLCGRERRGSILHQLLSMIGRRPNAPRGRKRKASGLVAGKFFRNQSPSYERVMEVGDFEDFEFASSTEDGRSLDSPNYDVDFNHSGRTSGMVTPALRALSPDVSRDPPKQRSNFDAPLGSPRGLSTTPYDRGGLLARSESKDWLTPANRSRRASPVRKSAPTTPFKKSVD